MSATKPLYLALWLPVVEAIFTLNLQMTQVIVGDGQAQDGGAFIKATF